MLSHAHLGDDELHLVVAVDLSGGLDLLRVGRAELGALLHVELAVLAELQRPAGSSAGRAVAVLACGFAIESCSQMCLSQ